MNALQESTVFMREDTTTAKIKVATFFSNLQNLCRSCDVFSSLRIKQEAAFIHFKGSHQ